MKKLCFVAAVCVMLAACSVFGADFEAMLERAERGDADAQSWVGYMYANGDGVKRDYKKACEWYEKAAVQDNAYALNALGYMYEHGLGVKQDYNMARELYQRATAKKFNAAMKKAKRGDIEAQCSVGFMYHSGLGVVKDKIKAEEWLLKAATQGHVGAQCLLGSLYLRFDEYRDYRKAHKWLLKAAAQNDYSSMRYLGKMYMDGLGVNVDYNKASEWFKKAAASNKSASVVKPTLAIRAFEDRTEEGKAPAGAVMDMMVTELTKAGVFDLMERERLDYIADEFKLGYSGLADTSTTPKVGKLLSAQYIMIGEIVHCHHDGKASYVVLGVRIIDVITRKIVYVSAQIGEAVNADEKTEGLLSMAVRDAVIKHVYAIQNCEWLKVLTDLTTNTKY